ncbi:hypothetical protein F5Y16DRAFT_414531 [Xylariaceae sp. FL0255]|nr:hypothetical protein F5Y16DRAFT_414531 [Xylariaceae sp. FL0255]
MRLLTRKDSRSFSLTDYPAGSIIPPYAILSHTWGTDEITYEDLQHGTGLRKSGYHKLRFCGEQAERDGFRYFWVDTCCIDKSSSAELTESINSMFRWYGSAAKCYVYLDDVCCPVTGHGDHQIKQLLRQSRWFTRGWTLQEVIAPKTVEFFSKEGTALGDKQSLELSLCDITGIPARALRGDPLPGFTVAERMAWAERRETTKPEDRAYSLLGIFHVQMPLIYGEGGDTAMKRLRRTIDEDRKGIQHEDFAVPFSLHGVPEIEHFVAREQELAEMRNALTSDGSRRVVVLHDNYSAIFWLNIKDEDSLRQSFAKMAHLIKRNHPSASRISSINIQKELDETIEAVKAWLSLPNNSRWLLVYDNYDNPNIQSHFPESHQGRKMSKLRNLDDSLKILRTTSKRQNLTEDPDARQLAIKLDGLPLALATAGAYLKRTPITFQSYLCYYENSWALLQKNSPKLMSYEDRTLYSTWQLSFDQIQRRNEHSAMLLRLWAYFDNQDLWFELLQHRDADRTQWVYEATKDELSFHNTIGVLQDYGLVEINSSTDKLVESNGYNIHSCVHSWTAHVLNQEWNKDLAKFALQCVASHVPETESNKWWIKQSRLLQHATKCSSTAYRDADGDMLRMFDSLGNLFRDQGRLKEAEEMKYFLCVGKLKEAEEIYHKVLRCSEKSQHFDPRLIATTRASLGNCYLRQDEPDRAENMYQQALKAFQKAGASKDPKTRGKLGEAEKKYQEALKGSEEAFGSDNIFILTIVHNLGNLYFDQEKLDKAEEMYQRALKGFEEIHGSQHESTINCFHNLGLLYSDLDRSEEAEKMFQQALPDGKALHTWFFDTLNDLGSFHFDQGDLGKARDKYRQAIKGYHKIQRLDDPSILDIANNLGNIYFHSGDFENAKLMYQRALDGLKKNPVDSHVLTLLVLHNLGSLHADKKHRKEAGEMYQRVIRGCEKTSSNPRNWLMSSLEALPSTNDYLNSLQQERERIFNNQGKLKEAKDMYQWALRGREKALGPDHTSTLSTVNNLGNLHRDQGKLREAKEMYQRTLRSYQTGVGPDHPRTQTVYGKQSNAEAMPIRCPGEYQDKSGKQWAIHKFRFERGDSNG